MKNQNIHMIAFLLLLCVGILAPQFANSQTEFGVKGGPLFSKLRNDFDENSIDINTKIGISAGVFYRINNLLGPVNLQIEFLYQLKGVESYNIEYYNPYYVYNYGFNQNPYGGYGYNQYNGTSAIWLEGDENFHYFSLPVLASVTLFKLIDVYAGPEIGYKFISSGKDSYFIAEKNFSVGISAGVAVHLGQNTKLDLRYSTDFTNLTDVTPTNLKNQGFGFIVQQTLFRKQSK
jgi:hypothetical protein